MQVRLEVNHDKSNVKRVVLDRDAVIGRGKECNLRIASKLVSRQHCRIVLQEEQVFVRDLGSSNGTFLSGERLPREEDIPVPSGARISIGGVAFVVHYDAPPRDGVPGGSTVELPAYRASNGDAAAHDTESVGATQAAETSAPQVEADSEQKSSLQNSPPPPVAKPVQSASVPAAIPIVDVGGVDVGGDASDDETGQLPAEESAKSASEGEASSPAEDGVASEAEAESIEEGDIVFDASLAIPDAVPSDAPPLSEFPVGESAEEPSFGSSRKKERRGLLGRMFGGRGGKKKQGTSASVEPQFEQPPEFPPSVEVEASDEGEAPIETANASAEADPELERPTPPPPGRPIKDEAPVAPAAEVPPVENSPAEVSPPGDEDDEDDEVDVAAFLSEVDEDEKSPTSGEDDEEFGDFLRQLEP